MLTDDIINDANLQTFLVRAISDMTFCHVKWRNSWSSSLYNIYILSLSYGDGAQVFSYRRNEQSAYACEDKKVTPNGCWYEVWIKPQETIFLPRLREISRAIFFSRAEAG
jgi:hypothetical protein